MSDVEPSAPAPPVVGVAFTSDVDWAPEPVIEDTLDLFARHGVPLTLFATHASGAVCAAEGDGVETAIHPNFNPLLDRPGDAPGGAAAVVDALLDAYPAARGVRSHSLTQSSRLSQLYADRGLTYESNTLLPYAPTSTPYRLWNGLVRIPITWQDDVHAMYGHGFDDARLALGAGLHVVAVHPVHLYLNTETPARWQAAKADYGEARRLARHRNRTGTPGTRDLVEQMLGRVVARGLPTFTLHQLAARVPEARPVPLDP